MILLVDKKIDYLCTRNIHYKDFKNHSSKGIVVRLFPFYFIHSPTFLPNKKKGRDRKVPAEKLHKT